MLFKASEISKSLIWRILLIGKLKVWLNNFSKHDCEIIKLECQIPFTCKNALDDDSYHNSLTVLLSKLLGNNMFFIVITEIGMTFNPKIYRGALILIVLYYTYILQIFCVEKIFNYCVSSVSTSAQQNLIIIYGTKSRFQDKCILYKEGTYVCI